MEKVIVENDRYRIVRVTSDPDKTLSWEVWLKGCRNRIRLGKATARLEEKQSMFIFWSYWNKIEFTNITNVVQEWCDKYFNGLVIK